MLQKHILCLNHQGFHNLAYTEWDQGAAQRTLVCVHGLTRNSRDFDTIAEELSTQMRVVCPDLVGRGASDWLSDAKYTNEQYAFDITALIARLNVPKISWLGTSLGGGIGLYLAAQKNSPIECLVLNDIGPFIPKEALRRIAKYAGNAPTFATLIEAEQYIRHIYIDSDPLTDAQWQDLTKYSVQQKNGTWHLAYDPKVIHKVPSIFILDINYWDMWEKITCPVLVLRGANSDILLKDTAERMQRTGPKATVIEVPNCGHAPSLRSAEQITIISNWLSQQK